MMDYTDRHCRYLMRLLSPSALLYTEMVTDKALLHGDPSRLLAFDSVEQPVALQLGGSDPRDLASAAIIGEQFGYREINLNCGCPSDRVKSGRFGACLMGEPERVAECISAMQDAVKIPVTVKCRIGIEPGMDHADDLQFLHKFVSSVAQVGCRVFIVHARRAVLNGLSPKENREIPPLKYDVVAQVQQLFPELQFVLNGGIRTVNEVTTHLNNFDGVMIGREAYNNPYLLAEIHRDLEDEQWVPDRAEIVRAYSDYVAQQFQSGERLNVMIKHVLGLYHGLPSARSWRRFLSEGVVRAPHAVNLLRDSLRIVSQ